MRINFYATLRPLAGGKSVDVTVAAPRTVCAALTAVTQLKPELADEIWQAPGKIKDHIHVFVNGREISFLQGLETALVEDDALDVFPPVGGGRWVWT